MYIAATGDEHTNSIGNLWGFINRMLVFQKQGEMGEIISEGEMLVKDAMRREVVTVKESTTLKQLMLQNSLFLK